ncbi:hypothetical protein ACW7EJ_18480, partial [Acinetobacter soli]
VFIDRAEIRGVSSEQDSSLVLLAKGKILLNRIDEFRNSSSPLQAFLFTIQAAFDVYNRADGIDPRGLFRVTI